MTAPVICFGQQPCGFFPKRFLVSKIDSARRLQSEIGGEIVFFYHDSDHDPRETKTVVRHRTTDETAVLNFAFENKLQKKYSPLYAKRIPQGWQDKTVAQLPNYVDRPLIKTFEEIQSDNIADFCLEMYRAMGLLEGISVVRSGSPEFRRAACDISDFFVDIEYENEIVRARFENGGLRLHKGGDEYIDLPLVEFGKEQISPARDSRLRWMQSVINCTHYIAGAGEQEYLSKDEAPEIEFITRDAIDRSGEAYYERE